MNGKCSIFLGVCYSTTWPGRFGMWIQKCQACVENNLLETETLIYFNSGFLASRVPVFVEGLAGDQAGPRVFHPHRCGRSRNGERCS
jgi:hypothetical protein